MSAGIGTRGLDGLVSSSCGVVPTDSQNIAGMCIQECGNGDGVSVSDAGEQRVLWEEEEQERGWDENSLSILCANGSGQRPSDHMAAQGVLAS